MKKVSKYLFFIILSIIFTMTVLSFNVSAETEYESGGYKYTVEDGKATIVSCDSTISGDVIIPSSFDEFPVTVIGEDLFRNRNDIISVTIPASVKTIKNSAFYDCDKISAVYITDISSWINISFHGYDTNPLYSGANLYLNGELVKELIIPEDITTIKAYAFVGCIGIENVKMHNDVTTIGIHAFENCTNLADLTISDNIKKISFAAFKGCTKLTEVNIPKSVTTIGKYAFYNCKELIEVNIPNTVKLIDEYAFENCSRLGNIVMPDSITSIGMSAFKNCVSLKSVKLSNKLKTIGIGSFYGCKSLEAIVIPKNVTTIKNLAFYYCSSMLSVEIPDSVTKIESSAFMYCKKLKTIDIPDSVTFIGGSAFAFCSQLKNVIIPDSVTYIGGSILEGCVKLKSLSIPFVGTSKEDEVFTNFGNIFGAGNYIRNKEEVPKTLKSVTLTNSLFIYDYAFYECSYITNIKLNYGIESIADDSFYKCSALETISIPQSVNLIYKNPFRKCKSLKTIKCYSGSEAHKFAKKNGYSTVLYRKHSFVNSDVLKATLSKNGYILKKCSNCGKVSKSSISFPKTYKLSAKKFVYSGGYKKPTVKIYTANGKLINANNYSITYKNNKYVGQAVVSIKFKGNYSGTKTLKFSIIPKAAKLSSIAANSKKSLKVSWRKQTVQSAGYEIQYSNSKKNVNAKIKNIRTNKTGTYTLKNLISNKTYYIRIRVYKMVNGKKYYSYWSAYMHKKTK